MKTFLTSKPGLIAVAVFTVVMAVMLHRVVKRRHERLAGAGAASATAVSARAPQAPSAAAPARTGRGGDANRALAENAAYLERYVALEARARQGRDGRGNTVTRRDTAAAPSELGATEVPESGSPAPVVPARTSVRLQGRRPATAAPPSLSPASAVASRIERLAQPAAEGAAAPASTATRPAPVRFNPYGRVIKCELVFTIDSTTEQCPLVSVVMEPVYNNGQLVIPAGAELHGVARPDRLRDRIFSGGDWVLVFPREPGRISGRQLNVKGVALDRVEPDANGMTWGITDGSYGLEGRVVRTMNDEEIRRFAATFLAAGTVALQDRRSDRRGDDAVRNTPQNAVLQGLAANFERIAQDISAEIEKHGVFIRVPAGHQFYFYPMQIIDPDAAGVSSDIATVR